MRFIPSGGSGRSNVTDDMVPYVAVTVGDEDANVVRITVQVKDAGDDNLEERMVVRVWNASSEWGVVESVGSWAFTTGVVIDTGASNCCLTLVSDAAGLIEIDVTEAGDYVGYIHAEIGGKAVSGGQISFST